MKYIVLYQHGTENIYLFPDTCSHYDMASRISPQCMLGNPNNKPVSAGVVIADGGEIVCTGYSPTLNLMSRNVDTDILIRALNPALELQAQNTRQEDATSSGTIIPQDI